MHFYSKYIILCINILIRNNSDLVSNSRILQLIFTLFLFLVIIIILLLLLSFISHFSGRVNNHNFNHLKKNKNLQNKLIEIIFLATSFKVLYKSLMKQDFTLEKKTYFTFFLNQDQITE